MKVAIVLPSLGDEEDDVRGGQVSAWLAAPGQRLRAGDDLLELTTDKAAFVVPCPMDGTLLEQGVRPGDTIRAGDALGYMESEAEA